MGRVPFYTDSEDTENTDGNSSIENFKNKRKSSILKYTENTTKKKKCKIHASKSEPDDSDYRSRSLNSEKSRHTKKLRGILKHDRVRSRERERQREKERERERDFISSEDEEDPLEAPKPHVSRDKYLVGRVPRPPGTKPGRGGGVALIVRRNEKEPKPQPVVLPKDSTIYAPKAKRKWLSRKKSY